MLRENRLQRLVDEGRFSRTRHARDNDEFAQWEFRIDVFEVVARGTADGDSLGVRCWVLGVRCWVLGEIRSSNHTLRTIQILRCNRVGLEQFVRRALKHHFTAFPTCVWADVDEVVGGEHHILVVFHDDDRVAKVAQLLERVDEALVVALMQSNRRLVEDVEHIDELRTDLRGEANALALTARQTGRLAVEREVVQSDAKQEIDACAQFLDDFGGNFLLHRFEVVFDFAEPVA